MTPLPEPTLIGMEEVNFNEFEPRYGYTADQMRAYGAAEYRRGIEDAARACHDWADDHAYPDACTYESCDFVAAAHDCAAAILKLGEKP